MAICVYSSDASDFSTNGLGLLTPTECKVSAKSGDSFEVKLIQPIDGTQRWAQLLEERILKAPTPVRISPEREEAPDDVVAGAALESSIRPSAVAEGDLETQGVSNLVERKIYRVYNTSTGVYMRSGPGKGYKNYGYLKNGAEVMLLDEVNASWFHVIVLKGGRECYMSTKYLTYDHSITEVVEGLSAIVTPVQARDQLFRIYKVERDSGNMQVAAYGTHIFYDMLHNCVDGAWEPKNLDITTALFTLWDKLMVDMGFSLHVSSMLSGKVSGNYGWKNPVEVLLDPDDGMLAQTGAKLVLDNYDVYVIPGDLKSYGNTIRRKKNLKAVKVTMDSSGAVTRIIPCGKDKDGKDLYLEGEEWVDSPLIDHYPHPRVKRIEYDAKTVKKDADNETTFSSDAKTRAKLRELAEKDFSENGMDRGSYCMDVDIVLLRAMGEAEDYANLQAVFLDEGVRVLDSVIGANALVRVASYTWNCLTGQYDAMGLGDVEQVEAMVYGYQLPTGGVSGSKIVPGSADGNILRDLTVQYAKISVAAIEQLNANAITAITGRFEEIVSGSITTDKLYAAIAEIMALKVGTLTAGSIETDRLAAALAQFGVITAGSAEFDRATIQHLVAEAMNLQFGVAGQVYIQNLAVQYAQMVGAAIGNLCIKASDGNYYEIDVGSDGRVTATKTTVTEGEAAAGQTDAGKVILGTNITAENLNTTNILGTFALINQIDAARIDVDTLVARQAFIDFLTTSQIFAGGKSLTIIAGEAANAKDAADKASRVFRSATMPTVADKPKAGDLWIVPDTNETWQAVAGEVAIRWGLDENGTLGYQIDGDYAGAGLKIERDILYADDLMFQITEDGTPLAPVSWEKVLGEHADERIDLATIYKGDEPPANSYAGKLWIDQSLVPPVLRECIAVDDGSGELGIDDCWRIVNDQSLLEDIQEEMRKQQAQLEEQMKKVNMAFDFNQADGLHIHRDIFDYSNETVVTDRSFDVRVNGRNSSSLAASSWEMDEQTVVRQTTNYFIFGG